VRRGHDAGITLDGPRGPLHEPKPGILALAHKTGGAIVPLRMFPSKGWRLRSWDGYTIPKPFSRIVIEYRPPVSPTGDQEADLALLKEALRDPVE
jgi:hypothetical protein